MEEDGYSFWSGCYSASTVAVSNTQSDYSSRTIDCRLSLNAMDALMLSSSVDNHLHSKKSYESSNDAQVTVAMETVRNSLSMREGICLESILHYFVSNSYANATNAITRNDNFISLNSAQWDLESRANRYLTYAPYKLPKKVLVVKKNDEQTPKQELGSTRCTTMENANHNVNAAEESNRNNSSIINKHTNIQNTKKSNNKRSVPVDVDDDVFVLNSDKERSQLRSVQENLNQFIETHQLAEAVELLKRVHRTVISSFGENGPEEASALFNLGNVQLLYGQYETSLKNFKRAIKIYRKLLKGDYYKNIQAHYHPFVALCMVKSGIALLGMGNMEGALKNMCEATEMRKTINKNSLDIMKSFTELISINNIGVTLSLLGKRDASLIVFSKALMKFESLPQHSDIDPTTMIDVSIVYSNIGNVLFQIGKHRKAYTQYKKVFDVSIFYEINMNTFSKM